ncbi:TRZ/ATZ family hydrolase [Solimonas soli]|uniref:TRZ/ATZ family hydrolase n=1 Tax=Solimonas soli TaxID=413479 RepID=UPI00047F3582|nr:TRZ/ATZ family hydrolase [Solimonas soli]
MQTVDLLVTPRWLIPIEPEGLVLEDHALVVDAGRIAAVLPLAEARARYAPRQSVALPQHALMPGLVNLHTHAAMSLLRGIADDLPLMDWLQNHIWPAEGAHVGAAFCEDGVRLACAEMIRGGTTCINDMYFFPDATARVAQQAGLRATVGLVVFDFPTAWGSGADDYIHKGLELHDALRDAPLIRTMFAPHAPYTVSDAPLLKLRRYANELGIGIHMHVHETAHEVETALASTGKRPWQRLKELELLGPDFIAVHMTQLSDTEIAEVAEYGVHVAHCPESNLKLASGFAPVGKLLAAGANVGIGTDGAASNNDLDLFGELRTAALLAKAVSGDTRALSAPTALRAATLGGARALGLEAEIGSLVAGKSADFIAVDLSAAATQPVYNVLSQLAYAVGREQVSDVWVAGRPLLRDRRLTTLDETAVIAKAGEWQQKIRP